MVLERYEIDPGHSGIQFSVRHLMISKVRGRFTRWGGTILMDEEHPEESTAEVVIDASSIDTGLEPRDADLRSANFLDVADYPNITYRTKRIERVDESHFNVVGHLTIRGVTREVPLQVEYAGRAADPYGNVRAAFSTSTSINRKDFGLTWNVALESGGVMVGDRVDIDADVEAIRRGVVARQGGQAESKPAAAP
jgi:polyisoprenoid-binding protein YceI